MLKPCGCPIDGLEDPVVIDGKTYQFRIWCKECRPKPPFDKIELFWAVEGLQILVEKLRRENQELRSRMNEKTWPEKQIENQEVVKKTKAEIGTWPEWKKNMCGLDG